jgi:hypothetical protein
MLVVVPMVLVVGTIAAFFAGDLGSSRQAGFTNQ